MTHKSYCYVTKVADQNNNNNSLSNNTLLYVRSTNKYICGFNSTVHNVTVSFL